MLQILRLDSKGALVEKWQNFLRGQGLYNCEATGVFDVNTSQATKEFQRTHGLDADGDVGPFTYAKALKDGFDIVGDDGNAGMSGPNWPPPPSFKPLSFVDRQKAFGAFQHVSAPQPGNPEAIQIGGTWVKDNIARAHVPQLASFIAGGNVSFHKAGADKLVALFAAWASEGLMDRILSWDGGWAPRYVRGSRVNLSNHAWGTAFDVNARWNGLGARPALVGDKGSVRELVEIANQQGFFWGGHYGCLGTSSPRSDGMHFEIAVP
jgi:hypothetical protein